MSVLIKGMKMPQSCYMCDMQELSGVVGCKHAYDTSNSEWGRALNCHLIEIPDHGDLIDRDVLKDECKEPYVWWETATQMAQILSDSPVVIPAERSEE